MFKSAVSQRLADRMRARDIARVVYFHTDHFEPCRNFDGRPILGAANVTDVTRFAREIAQIEFARKLTLFHKPQLNFALRRGEEMMFAHPDDKLGFVRRTPAEDGFARDMLQPLAELTGCQFQLHVHHENYTSNATNTAAKTDVGAYLATPLGAKFDSARFEFALKLNLELLENDTGWRFDRWFFIHGHWALNASDDADCRIVDEIEILHRNGCLGDFTCPAGRTHVDPRHERPFLCRPVNVPKGYDTKEAEPEPAGGAGRQRGDEKFLVWASKIKHGATSIDHSSNFVRKRGDNLEAAAAKLIDDSYVHDRTLYIKTHAHSMHPAYFDGKAPACFPHQFPATRDMLSLAFDAGVAAGAEVLFETVSEVYDRLLLSPVRSDVDMLAAFATGAPVQAPGATNKQAVRSDAPGAPPPAGMARRVGGWFRDRLSS